MYRNKSELICQVLELTQSKTSPTSVMRQVNVPHARFKELLQKLYTNNLIVKFDDKLVITERGRVYLNEYRKFLDFAKDFGMEL